MDVDLVLRRVQSTSLVVCLITAAGAAAAGHGQAWPAVAVIAGGFLAGISYRMIVSSAEAIVRGLIPGAAGEALEAGRRPSPALTGAKVIGRYALLALLAYVMIARLRLPPLWLLAGASSVVAAVSIEALRVLLKKTR